jgi:O-antigen/teichoic acid export membrane protein
MVIKDAMMTVGVRVTLIVAGLATTIITARWLGPAGRGDYFFVVALSAMAGQIVHLGLHASNAFYVAKNPKLFGALAVNSYWASVVLGGIAAATAITAIIYFGQSNHSFDVLYWALLLTPTGLATLYIGNLYVGVGRITEYNAVQLASAIVPFALICGVAAYSRTAPAFLAAASIAGVLNQLVLASYSLRGQSAQWRFDARLFRAGLPFAIRAYVINALCTMTLKAPALMFTAAPLKSELGYFSIAAQVFDAISVVPASIAAVLFPVLMKLEVDRWRETRRYMAILMGLALLVAVVMGMLSNVFVDVLFGARFAGAAAPLRIILPAAVFVSGTSLLSQYLATHGMPRSTALAWLAAAVICIGLGPILVRTHGAVGAALVLSCATGVAWIILLALSLRVSRRFVEHLTT